ncbi:hypothetical protein JCM19233_7004 [Vibrio astriarenae]|nr:hypothetical protein JCM19233_7004 [Vibrio sp. C7]
MNDEVTRYQYDSGINDKVGQTNMIRLISIVALIVIAFLLIRYRTNEKLQKIVVISVVGAFLVYAAGVMITELAR